MYSDKCLGPAPVDRIDKSVLILAAAILIYELFLPPVVGVANNGDFGKLIARFNLGAPFEDEFRYAATKYNFDPKYHYDSGIISSELLPVFAALGLNALVSKSAGFDIRWMGAVHSVLFLLALYLLQPVLRDMPDRARILLWVLILLVFCDVVYTSLFNSFYMDAGAFLFLLLGATLFLRAVRSRTKADAVGFVVCGVLLISTKPQHCLLGIPLALFVLIWPQRPIGFKLSAATFMLLATWFTWNAAPPAYNVPPLYTIIFKGVLPASKDAAADLTALGLDGSYAPYIDTHGFSAGNPLGNESFLRTFTQRTSYPRLGYFFLTHPASAYGVICDALGQAGRQKPNLGNYDKSAGMYPWKESRAFVLWSRLKRSLFYWKGVRYLWYFIGVVVFSLLAAATRATNVSVAPICLLISFAVIELGVAGFGDAAEVTRHFFLFNAILDMLWLSAVAIILGLPAVSSMR